MYEQQSHSLLNAILNQIEPEFSKHDLRYFYTRLGANFYAIHSLFERLYGKRPDFAEQAQRCIAMGSPKICKACVNICIIFRIWVLIWYMSCPS